jgi:hypothetical protein
VGRRHAVTPDYRGVPATTSMKIEIRRDESGVIHEAIAQARPSL